jgi:hypothetical protein
LVDAAARFEDDGEERALTELGDPQADIAGLGRGQPWAAAVALGGPVVGAFVAAGADPLGGFGFDQLLHHHPDRLTDQIDAITGAERIEQLGQGRLGQGHRWVSFSA